MLKSAKDVVASGVTASVVDFAIEADRTIKALTRELEVVKAALREKGLSEAALSGENSVEIEGTLGVAQIVMVRPTPKAKKGVDLLASEAGLPSEVFASLFVKRTVVDFAEDFEVKLSRLPPAQKAVIQNLVEITASTPRVNLPR